MSDTSGLYVVLILAPVYYNNPRPKLRNCAFLKIGYTSRNIDVRVKELEGEFKAKLIIPIIYGFRPETSRIDCLSLERLIKANINLYQIKVKIPQREGCIKTECYAYDTDIFRYFMHFCRCYHFHLDFCYFDGITLDDYENKCDELINIEYDNLVYKFLDDPITDTLSDETIRNMLENPLDFIHRDTYFQELPPPSDDEMSSHDEDNNYYPEIDETFEESSDSCYEMDEDESSSYDFEESEDEYSMDISSTHYDSDDSMDNYSFNYTQYIK